ncbi:RAP domain-containing protein [Endozoicomonas acroporae]|uniref:RAP domain-containing protein n=1 Tax=Endozoicomonas acroporae TaxID=1701104 RepID=UPI003D79A009
MDSGSAGISWKCTTSGNDCNQPDDHTGASGSGRYRYGTVRRTNTSLPYIPERHEFYPASDACSANHPSGHSIKPVQDFNALITQAKMDDLVRTSTQYGDRYNGKKHSQFACSIKQYTSSSKRPLNRSEQCQLIPLLHAFKATPGWPWRSLTTTIHAFTSAGVFTPHKYMNENKEAQAALLSTLLDAVIVKCKQKPEARDIDAQGTANLLWALAKMVGNGLELEKTPKLKEAVAALLPRAKIKAESKDGKDFFIPQHIANLLWAVAKLVDNGLELEKTPKLKEVVAALLLHVKTKAESKEERDHFNTQGTGNLLWAMAKLVDHGLKLEKTPKLKEALAALLLQVKTKAESKEEKDHFIPQHIANQLWALAKLVDNGLELEKTAILKEAVVALLPRVKTKAEAKEEKDPFIPQHIANQLWALAKLVDNGLEPEKTAKLKEVVAALLLHVKTKAESKEEKDHFRSQGTANLLWALAKLVENGLDLEKTAQLKEAVAALLPHVKIKAESKEEKDHFKPQEVANLLWAMAKLLDNGLKKTSKFREAVAALLANVKTKAKSKEEKDHFIPQHISNLLWAVARLVDNGLELEKTPKLKEVVVALLPHVKAKAESKEEKDHFNTQATANLLWALAKLVDNGLELEKTGPLNEAVAALLPHLKTKAESKEKKDFFNTQGVVNLLWAVAKLVDNGLESEKVPKLTEVLVALLPHVKTKAKEQKNHFIPQHIVNLLWALAKLVDIGLELEKTAILKETLAALLYHVKTKAESKDERDHFNAQGLANLVWALAKLGDIGLELEKTVKLKETLTALLYRVKTKAESKEERDRFIPQGIVNLLWALAKLGEAIELNLIKSTFDALVARISETPQRSQQNIWMSLWGVMVFCARFYLCFGINNKNPLEQHIGKLFSRLESTFPDDLEAQTVIAMAASWLGRPCAMAPCYQTNISQSQTIFREQLQSSLPSLQIEEEKSLNSLPPVDLLLPDYNMVIDVQGPYHYVSGDFKTRNGSTLLKVALLQKLGFEVIEIPVNKLWKKDSMKRVIEQITTRLAVQPEAHGSVLHNSDEGVTDEAYVTADEGGLFSDGGYATAEEYSEEQINKPKKRKRKRKRANKRLSSSMT